MARQIIPAFFSESLLSSSTGLGIFTAATAADVANGLCQAFMPTSGTFTKLRFVLGQAPGAGCSWTLALCVNGTDSALSITVSDTATEGTIATNVAVSAGDLVRYTVTKSGSAAALTFEAALEFEPTTAGQYVYGAAGDVAWNDTTYASPVYGQSEDATIIRAVTCAGTITRMDVNMADGGFPFSSSPGSGNTIVYALEVNGVVQDGTGGTVDTTVSCSGSTNTGTKTFALAVAEGDLLRVQIVTTGTPNIRPPAVTVLMTAESQMFAMSGNGSGLTTTPTYIWIVGSRSSGIGTGYHWSATEAARQLIISSSFRATGLIIGIDSSEPWTSGDSVTLTLRKNGADTALTVTITDPTLTGSISGSVLVAAGDLLAFKGTATNGRTPAVWATLIGSAASDPKQGCLVVGVNTTLKATNAVSFGLDDETHVDTEDGTFTVHGKTKLDGDVEFTGTTTGITASVDSLSDVGDVSLSSPVLDGDQLVWDTTTSKWINAAPSGGGGNVAVSDLTDVSLSSPVSDGDILVYRTSSPAGWVNEAPSAGSGSGSLILLEQHTASGSASLDFTSFISSTYDTYLIVGTGIVPASNAVDLNVEIGTGGTPTYDTGSNYEWASGGLATSGIGVSNSGSTGIAKLLASMGNTSGWSGQFSLTACSLQSTTLRKTFFGTSYFINSTPLAIQSSFGMQWTTTGTAVTALRFIMSSGNIASGTIRIYGMVK